MSRMKNIITMQLRRAFWNLSNSTRIYLGRREKLQTTASQTLFTLQQHGSVVWNWLWDVFHVAAIQAKVTKQKQDSEDDLAKAGPALTATNAALTTLNRVDDFLQNLVHFDKEHTREIIVTTKQKDYLCDPEFNPELCV